MTRRPRRTQPRIVGGRDALFSAVLPETRERLIEIAKANNCSPSWVAADALAEYCGTTKRQPRYDKRQR